jgi:hypothetical protein
LGTAACAACSRLLGGVHRLVGAAAEQALAHELESHLADGLAAHVVALAVREAWSVDLTIDDLQLVIELADRHVAIGSGAKTRSAGRVADVQVMFS